MEWNDFPLIFSGSMVRSNHAGIKRMTRRVVALDRLKVIMRKDVTADFPLSHLPSHNKMVAPAGAKLPATIHGGGAVSCMTKGGLLGLKPGEFDFVCPYAVGETVLTTQGGKQTWTIIPHRSRIWVRESWYHIHGDVIPDHRSNLAFRADYPDCVDAKFDRPLPDAGTIKWVPSIHMPRWASRDIYGVTKVRLELLQDVTEEDAIAEGIEFTGCISSMGRKFYKGYDPAGPKHLFPLSSFATLWDSINGDRPARAWDANPLVWVVEYDNPAWKVAA